ncbi:uncharacterized protein LOC143852380 [Tasmannia lanceolata]|uniref:uncharacterized protein LOC143852380 n=1 Tax=Tasmannia lanceolata TaxID=3420 RepID=UPI004063DDFC
MASNNMLQPQLPRFNSKNYNQWSIQMKVLYGSQDLWDIEETGVEEPEDQAALTLQQLNELKDNRKKDKKALFFIYQAVREVIFERISSVTSAKEAWDTLYTSYKGDDKVKLVRLQTLRYEFDALRMKDSESVEDYYNHVISLVNQLRVNGEDIQDRRIGEKILRSLTRKFEYIVVAIEESKDLASLSLESFLGSLQSHELRMKQFDSSPLEQAFQNQVSFREGSRGRYCRKKIAEESKKISTFMHEKDESKEEDTLFLACNVQEVVLDETWYLDSGCSNHMIGNKGVFVKLDESLQGEVQTGDDKRLSVRRSGVFFFSTLSLMNKKHVVGGMPNIDRQDQVCERCALGKHQRDSFLVVKAWRALNPLQLVHSDLFEPMQTTSIGGNRYFLTFIDDYSRKTWVYFLKEKSEVFECFKIFRSLVEKQSGFMLETLRSNRDGEYVSHEFENFLENGIRHQLTTWYTPQQNGVAERKNRTIMELARSMLKANGMPHMFWVEAVACAIYLLNQAS